MTEIVLNERQARLLADVHGPVKICDGAGNVLGFISPGEFAGDRQYTEDIQRADAGLSRHVEHLIRDGIDSGVPVALSDDWWEQKKTALANRIGKQTATNSPASRC